MQTLTQCFAFVKNLYTCMQADRDRRTHCCSLLREHNTINCNTLQHGRYDATTGGPAPHRRTATQCNTLQHTSTHVNTLQHAASQLFTSSLLPHPPNTYLYLLFSDTHARARTHAHSLTQTHLLSMTTCYGVATISRLLKIIGLVCKRAL